MIDYYEPPAVAQAAADMEDIGKWKFWERRDPITDQVRAGAGLVTSEGSLAVKCDEAGPGSVYVSFSPAGVYFGDGRSTVNRRPFIFRIDDQPPIEVLWRYGDSSALLIDRPEQLTGPLMKSERIALRGMTYRFVSETRTFETDGAADAVARVYAACGDTTPAT